MAFTPDGRHVVSGGGEDVKPDLYLWELPADVVSAPRPGQVIAGR